MKIDCELTPNEKDVLAMMMGALTGFTMVKFFDPEKARTMIRVMNKLYALSPDYVPYDPDSYDPNTEVFPFKKLAPQ